MLAGLKLSSLVCKCEFFRPEPNAKGFPSNWILKTLKCKNEMHQRIEPTE